MSYRVFISHSLKDVELARDLARRLMEAGVIVFRDEESFQPGVDLRSKIMNTIGKSDEVIVLLTDHSADSPWIRYEMGMADALDKRLTPVVVNEGIEQLVPMVGKHFIKYADLPKYISSLKKRTKAA